MHMKNDSKGIGMRKGVVVESAEYDDNNKENIDPMEWCSIYNNSHQQPYLHSPRAQIFYPKQANMQGLHQRNQASIATRRARTRTKSTILVIVKDSIPPCDDKQSGLVSILAPTIRRTTVETTRSRKANRTRIGTATSTTTTTATTTTTTTTTTANTTTAMGVRIPLKEIEPTKNSYQQSQWFNLF